MELIHGGDWAGYAQEFGEMPLDFSANVSPLGVPARVQQSICGAAGSLSLYPDPLCRSLRDAIGQKEQLPADAILCGNGAADLIFRAALAVKPTCALIPAPTFAEYEAALTTVSCKIKRFMLSEANGFALPPAFIDAICPGIDMVFLCQPNNPTGLVSPRAFLLQVLQKCRQVGAVLVLDECFNDFLPEPAAHTLCGQVESAPNLIILKAFTKLYAMAGVRLGYALCGNPLLVQAISKAGQPWAVSTLAQQAGLAALQERNYVQQLRGLILQQRPRLEAALRMLGLRVIPGQANYLLFYCETPLCQPLRRRGILVRNCENYPGLGFGWYRIAVRTQPENDRLLFALSEVLQ